MDEFALSNVKPAGVTLDKPNHMLVIDWGGDHIGNYLLDALREACPCVVCRGGHENMGAQHDPDFIMLTPARSYQVVDLQIVGNYALQVSWDDGHNTGIYTWDYLRRICPCPACAARRDRDTQSPSS